MLTDAERRFLRSARVAYLATADTHAAPHVIPVCFAVDDHTIYITIDDKPKRVPGPALKRLRNIAENPKVALVVDRYDDLDWTCLSWLLFRGRAAVLHTGPEHAEAQHRLRARYRQLKGMDLEKQPVIVISIERVTSWGNLEVGAG